MAISANSELNIEELNSQLKGLEPSMILKWAWEKFSPNIVATSSFQTQSVPLLHMVSLAVPDLPILFLDTGFHFPETLFFRDQLAEEFGIDIRSIRPTIGKDGFRQKYGELYRNNPDLCCYINKVEPLKLALKGLRAWITGIRRDQTTSRSKTQILSKQPDGMIKVCPLAYWTKKDVWNYINQHNLPEHPLLSQGYLSIGCSPCTRPSISLEDPRSGRWANQEKTECGIHTIFSQKDIEE
jgi:phosphoadenosine phosphosulfate reductase